MQHGINCDRQIPTATHFIYERRNAMSIPSQQREQYCCFTGHRPEKMNRTETEIRLLLEQAILAAIRDGFDSFISGMARGTDIWAAEIVLRFRDAGYPVRLICASPYPGVERGWSFDWQKRYRRVLDAADRTTFICPGYRQDCFRQRNKWMVDHSARVIAVYSGAPGGTRNTVQYALAQGIPVVNVTGVDG